MTAALANTRETYVPAARLAAVREAVRIVVGGDLTLDGFESVCATAGDADLACWALVWETERLARMSDTVVPLDDAWAAFCDCWQRLGGPVCGAA